MIERLLIGALALGLPEDTLNVTDDDYLSGPKSSFDLRPASRFHVGMLSVSLIVGLGYGGFAAYSCWVEENIFLSYIRNLVIALVCRTFFSLVFDAVIILGSPFNVGGGNTLSAFESISENLVVAFWLLLTVYLHARMHRNFNNEPCLTLYQLAIPGVAAFFAFVWIFAMEGEYGMFLWWQIYYLLPATQWITNSLRLLYLLVQLALLVDVGRMTMNKSSLDNDSISLLRKVSILMAVLVFLFWLHFGLNVGRPPQTNPESYFYFFYFIDGILCAAVCPIFFFMDRWVPLVLDKVSHVLTTEGERAANPEVCVDGTGSIVTIDSVLALEGPTGWPVHPSTDVVYSSVVHPDKLKNTLDLYKRLNAIPVVVGGEEFYDCGSQRPDRRSSRSQKKNAFYSSKYLIVEPKKEEFPRYLDTRGSGTRAKAGTPPDEPPPAPAPAPAPAEASVEQWLKDCPEAEEETGKDPEVPSKDATNKANKENSEREEKDLEKPIPKTRRKFSHTQS